MPKGNEKIDAAKVKAVRGEIEALVKQHGMTVVRRAWNNYHQTARLKENLKARQREIEQELEKLKQKLGD